MKKFLKLFVCLGMVISLAACSSDEETTTESKIADGTYSATVESMKGDMTVTVTIADDKMTDITVDTVDTDVLVSAAIDRMVPDMIENQTIKVDSLSGATVSSAAIKAGVKGALEEAGVDTSTTFNTDATHSAVEKEDETADVVVVGSGGAGLSTAIQLKENGIENVVVVEKLGYFGGTTALCSGGAWSVGGSVFNEKTGIDYTADELIEHLYAASDAEEGSLNEELIRNIASVSAEIFDYYYNECGNPFDIDTVDSYGDSLGEMPVAWTDGAGQVLIENMVEQAEKLGVDLRLDSKVTSLLVEDDTVTGVHIEGRDEIYDLYASKVVLATGGIQRNSDLVSLLTPGYENEVPFTSAGSTGEGIQFALDLGAGTIGNTMGGMQGLGERFGYEGLGSSTWGVSILVNQEGERFVDESLHYSYRLPAIMEQTDGICYGIADTTSYAYDNFELMEEYGYAYHADSIEELAALINIDADTLQATVDAYNETAEDQLAEGPYYAIKMDGVAFASMAGVTVDEFCHITKTDGSVIPNLYGAGEMCSGNILQNRYAGSGSQVGASLYEGKIIADQIAEELK